MSVKNGGLLLGFSETRLARTVRSGLVTLIPILMIGSFALVLRSLPITAYLSFIESFANGTIIGILNFVYNATFGMLSFYMTVTISYAYAQECLGSGGYMYGAPLACLGCFAIFTGVLSEGFVISSFGVRGMFTAIISAMGGSTLYFAAKKLLSRRRLVLVADGVDMEFNNALSVLFPILLVLAVAAVINVAVIEIFDVTDFHQFFVRMINGIFSPLGRSMASGALFVLCSSVLWFFGIHGSDVLENVVDVQFTPAMDINIAAVAAGEQPTEILTKTFFDLFVLMGGCGTTLCLLFALWIFSKRRNCRSISRFAAIPMIFNINELMVFGLPIIYNPVMLAPFLLTPLVIFFTSYTAMALGIVPVTSSPVEWTTPVLLSGYLSTGSITGSMLQLFNIAIGVAIYAPFIRMLDKSYEHSSQQRLSVLLDRLKESERSTEPVQLIYQNSTVGNVAKALANDLLPGMENGELAMYYQPQFDQNMRCIGAEALLRWNHPSYGILYPPLVIKLADEVGCLPQLERFIIARACADMKKMRQSPDVPAKLCVNITSRTLYSSDFVQFLADLCEEDAIVPQSLCLEMAEQMAFDLNEHTYGLLSAINELGICLAVDDFSMGHTSLKYLRSGHFNLVKLDGSLIQGMRDNPSCKEIISSIIHLSESLNFEVLAEFVETPEQREQLEALGCCRYQGFLLSEAVPLEDYIKLCESPKA